MRRKNTEIAQKIKGVLVRDYGFYNTYQISKETGINWETTNSFLNILFVIGILEKVGNAFRWKVVPKRFFDDYKKQKEEYINVLEKRLWELRLQSSEVKQDE